MRCALTFLAIQEPGISKYCERCGKQYLTEEALLKDEVSQGNSDRTDVEVPAPTIGGHSHTNFDDDAEAQASLMAQHQVSSPSNELAPLVRMLFSNYDVCVFCGGKFVG